MEPAAHPIRNLGRSVPSPSLVTEAAFPFQSSPNNNEQQIDFFSYGLWGAVRDPGLALICI